MRKSTGRANTMADDGKRAVLIVDDDEGIRETLCLALELEGFDAVAAEHGKIALEYLKSHSKPHLVILDLMMPVMNGWDFLHAVRDIPEFSSLPIVVVTAFAARAKGLAVQGQLEKPVELEALLSTVKQFCCS